MRASCNAHGETVTLARELQERGVPVAGFYPNIQTVLPGTALDHGLAARGHELDFYSMPRATQFADFEDGVVGYNFLTLDTSSPQALADLARVIATAGSGIHLRGCPRGNNTRLCALVTGALAPSDMNISA